MKTGFDFASAGLTAGQLNAIVKKIGGHNEALRFLRGELMVSTPKLKWREHDGVIHLTISSSGISRDEWVNEFELNCIRLTENSRNLILGQVEKTSGVVSEIAILRGILFDNNDRTTQKIAAEAKNRGLINATLEESCLVFNHLTVEEMTTLGLKSLNIFAKDVFNHPFSISMGCDPINDLGVIDTKYDKLREKWGRNEGFAYVLSRVNI